MLLVVVLLPFRVFPQRKLGIFLNRSFRRKRRKRTVFFTRNVLREREMFFCHARAKERRKGKGEREEVSEREFRRKKKKKNKKKKRESARALKSCKEKMCRKNESQIVPKISRTHTPHRIIQKQEHDAEENAIFHAQGGDEDGEEDGQERAVHSFFILAFFLLVSLSLSLSLRARFFFFWRLPLFSR